MRPGPDPYRSVYVPKAMRSNPSQIGAPWLLLSESEIAEWRLRSGATTPSEKIARCLAWLEQEFGVSKAT